MKLKLLQPFFWGFILLGLSLSSCKQIVTGYYSRDEFLSRCEWKTTVNQKYIDKKVKPEDLNALRSLKDSVDVQLFLGTWCSDSKKLVPKFFALQPYLPIRKLEIIAMDTTKKDSLGWYKTLAVDSVPTLIFYRNEKQIGRLNVKPPKRVKLEKRLYQILKP